MVSGLLWYGATTYPTVHGQHEHVPKSVEIPHGCAGARVGLIAVKEYSLQFNLLYIHFHLRPPYESTSQ